MVNNSHQYQQSEQTSLNIDGHQFTTISTKRTIISKQWWSTIHTNINNASNHLQPVMVNNSHQYQQSEQSPLNSDVQQLTPISTKRTMTCKQWWSTIHTNVNKANNHIKKVMVNNSYQYQQNKESPLNSDGQ
jgi:phage terminase large subunit-like protein